MSHLSLPLSFGDRPCDRDLADILAGSFDPAAVIGYSLRVWRDFGIARDDRRLVPRQPSARRESRVVRTIHRFIAWPESAPVSFVESAIEAGFFRLVPSEQEGLDHLVLVDFFPANRGASGDFSSARLGGAAKSVRNAEDRARESSSQQLEMFRQTSHQMLQGRTDQQVKEGLLFIHQLCNVCKLPAPQAREWKEELLVQALAVKARVTPESIERTFRWLVVKRRAGGQEIPERLDFVLKEFPALAERAERDLPG